jgi:dolichol-phosphate mannosyltransferase
MAIPLSIKIRKLPFKRLFKFSIVGGSGVFVNEGFLILFHGYVHLPLLLSSILAVEISKLSNFILNSLWTWQYDYGGSLQLWIRKYIQYQIVTALSIFIGNTLLLMALVKLMGMDYRIANLIGIFVGSFTNFLLNNFWTFRKG